MKDAAAFIYRHELPVGTEPTNMPGRSEIFAKLRQRDLLPLVTVQAEEAFTDDGVEAMTLTSPDEHVTSLGHMALDRIGVIVNRLDRSIKKDLIPRPDLLPSMINENATRSLAFRKIRAHTEVLEPLALDMPTTLISSAESIDMFLEENAAQTMIIKPNSGSNGKGITRASRDSIMTLLSDRPDIIGTHIIQPAYDFTGSFPKSVRPYDTASHEAFEGWNVPSQIKEVRAYGFYSPRGTDVFPVARAFQNGDQWFFVDPDSLPSKVIEGTRQAIHTTAQLTGARALLGTVDYGYGSVDGAEPDWCAIELNARMPYVVGYDKHPVVANILREYFADQIQATVQAG